MPIEFEFIATPELGPKAMRYLLWRRGGPIGPIAIILTPIVMAADPEDASRRLCRRWRRDHALPALSSGGGASLQNATALLRIDH